MEINKPGGFLLLMLDRLSDKNTTIEYIESKIRKLEQLGITTYDFVPGFGDEYVSMELLDDLRVFVDVGWINLNGFRYILTNHGKRVTKDYEIPEIAKEAFEELIMDA